MSHPALENRPNPLYVKSMLLSVYIKPITQELIDLREFNLADQLSRSIRSVKNNVNEAQTSESRADFIHKLKIADKELHEATGMVATEHDACPLLESYHMLILELLSDVAKLIGKSISTTRINKRLYE